MGVSEIRKLNMAYTFYKASVKGVKFFYLYTAMIFQFNEKCLSCFRMILTQKTNYMLWPNHSSYRLHQSDPGGPSSLQKKYIATSLAVRVSNELTTN